ncbi:hypothetical protein DOY81_014981 [Sarcophaga bullata]|nr:hypothetical protein DOY81_014981 [Sarcophaga bullata]
MSYKIEEIPGSLADMGEGPHWDVTTQNLYYVDINAGKILRYNYNENKVYKAKVDGERFASFIIPVEGTNDQFAVGCGRRVLIVQWDGVSNIAKSIKCLFEVQMHDDDHVMHPRKSKILLEIKLPCLHITSVAFGGPNLDILFVTTATEGGLPPPSGSVFKVTGLGAQGYPMTKIQI